MKNDTILSQYQNIAQINSNRSAPKTISSVALVWGLVLGVFALTAPPVGAQNQPQSVPVDKAKWSSDVSDKSAQPHCSEDDWRKGVCIQTSGGRRLSDDERKQLRQQLKGQ